MDWQPYENGATLGRKGSEGGAIIKDEEYPAGARLTLESRCKMAPLAITCGVYGWMVHTAFYADQMTAEDDYAKMKVDLATIADMRSREDLYEHIDDFQAAIDRFIENY